MRGVWWGRRVAVVERRATSLSTGALKEDGPGEEEALQCCRGFGDNVTIEKNGTHS